MSELGSDTGNLWKLEGCNNCERLCGNRVCRWFVNLLSPRGQERKKMPTWMILGNWLTGNVIDSLAEITNLGKNEFIRGRYTMECQLP